MTIEQLVDGLKTKNKMYKFEKVISLIDENYDYQPTQFSNGLGKDALINDAGTNEGSCKVFAFASLHQLNQEETLRCFAEHYENVLAEPEGTAHANIRSFMKHGWPGIAFERMPLTLKSSV